MVSLSRFLSLLAPNFYLTVPAIYERQRALVRLGHLKTPEGRGRGSGAEATPETVAILLVALLATDNLSDVDDRISRLANARFDTAAGSKVCPLTGAKTFVDALAAIMSSEDVAASVDSIEVSRTDLWAALYYRRPKRRSVDLSYFGQRWPRSFQVRAEVSGGVLLGICQSLNANVGGAGILR